MCVKVHNKYKGLKMEHTTRKCTRCNEIKDSLEFEKICSSDFQSLSVSTRDYCNTCQGIVQMHAKARSRTTQAKERKKKIEAKIIANKAKRCPKCDCARDMSQWTISKRYCDVCIRFIRKNNVETGNSILKREEIALIKEREQGMSSKEKSDRLNKEQDMIARFLNKENK